MHKKYRKTATRNFIKFFFLFIGLYWLCGCNRLMAQTSDSVTINGCYQDITGKKILIADETTYTQLKSQIKIETSNEEIASMLDSLPFKTKIIRNMTDRNGKYQEVSYYFRKEDVELINKWIKTLK